MAINNTFREYIQSAFEQGYWATDDLIAFVLPLFEEVAGLHEANLVAPFEKPDSFFINEKGKLDLDDRFIHGPVFSLQAVHKLQEFRRIHGYTITDDLLIDTDVSQQTTSISNRQIQTEEDQELQQPVFLPGYTSWEMLVGHHDAQTDIFCLGLLLGSLAMGLDLYETSELQQFAAYRNQPAGINSRLHPTLCAVIAEMTELDRRQRSPDLVEIIQRLRYYRDYDPQRRQDLSNIAAFQVKKPTDRKAFILSKLRNRLFDTSRRNRLLYYKPNSRFVNLTVSSVPNVLHYQSINPQSLFTWNEDIGPRIIRQQDLSLNKYLRFEDHPYLNSQLNSVRQLSEADKREYGFSQLKLVVAFLHWNNLKEAVNERIQSPLLLLPVELERKKAFKEEQFTLKIIDNTAMINPVLANLLKDLYGIILPENIDFEEASMQQFFELLKEKIDDARQGVKLNYIDKPRIKLIHYSARQTINNYRKKLKSRSAPFLKIDYSYSEEDYKPLGLELFRQKVEPQKSTLEFLLQSEPAARKPHYFAEAVSKEAFQLAEGENNPYSWEFDICNLVLGNFNYKKMSLVSDYNKMTEDGIEHPVFNELFSNEPRQLKQELLDNNPAEWYHVITADPTQAKAVLHSRTGNSYIIQGPPGTGKSQTITNLIADFLAQGKTVLFVCEKRAALDVVYYRLQQNQLSELCCYIHDSQGDKKEFIRDLRVIYDDFVKNKMDLAGITRRRDAVLDRLLHQIDTLQVYHGQQCNIQPEAGISTRQLVETLVQLKEQTTPNDPSNQPSIPDYEYWLQFGQTIQQLSTALQETGAQPQLANHPFSNLSTTVVQAENPFTLIESLVTHCNNAIRELSAVLAQNQIPPQYAAGLEQLKSLVQNAVILEPLAQSNHISLAESSSAEAADFDRAYQQYKEVQELYQEAIDKNKRWLHKFEKEETDQALQLAVQQEKSFFRFLNGNWRKLKKQLQASYDFSSHQVPPPFSAVLQQLQQEYRQQEELNRQKQALQKGYGFDNVDTVYLGIEVLRRKKGDAAVNYLLQHPHAAELVPQLSRLNNTLHQLEVQLQQFLYNPSKRSLKQLRDELATIEGNAEALKDLLPALRRFSTLPAELQQFIRELPLTPLQAQAAMAGKTLQLILDRNRSFSHMNQAMLQETVGGLGNAYKELLQLNSDYIRALRRKRFLEHYELCNTSATVLSPEQKLLKKAYTDGRRILEHEMSKTMRYKSIRELASNDSGQVLKDIKPVWLMSPLSVSDSLPVDAGFFDVVIFDEASQITLEEGVPALFRAPQSIIVGDEKQMPPSNFFNAKTEDPEDLEVFEGEREDEILSTEADSLLVQGARKLDSTMLSWHYRSRYETLISYSNHAFYEAQLLTIPDQSVHYHEKPLLEVQQPEEGAANASLLLQGSISFHYLPRGIYEARCNDSEAAYIARLVKQLLTANVEETIGIVAFSQEQQQVIEDAINQLAYKDKAYEELLEKAYNRRDDGQFTGLFVKNLENVQGDERDIIIMSICYGHDHRQKMLMNFGPINRKGGEKRLNVIFSRARKHMAVVSSIRHHHITNDYNDGASYFKRFLHYAEMVSTGNMSLARTILDGLVYNEDLIPSQGIEPSVVAQQLKQALEEKGYVVDEQVGQSSFKCTLAVKLLHTDDHYRLGILIDDAAHYNNDDLVEQYYQRPAILQAFGWNIVNVYGKDWLEEPERVLQQLYRQLENKEMMAPAAVEEAAPPVKEDIPATTPLPVTRLSSADGELFWEILQEGDQLKIRFGKTGTKGQVQIKSFDTEQEAANAKEALIAEQLEEGNLKMG